MSSHFVVIHQDSTMPFKSAFLQAVEEYNGFGSALYSPKLKVDNNDALQLYGLKATWQTGSHNFIDYIYSNRSMNNMYLVNLAAHLTLKRSNRSNTLWPLTFRCQSGWSGSWSLGSAGEPLALREVRTIRQRFGPSEFQCRVVKGEARNPLMPNKQVFWLFVIMPVLAGVFQALLWTHTHTHPSFYLGLSSRRLFD